MISNHEDIQLKFHPPHRAKFDKAAGMKNYRYIRQVSYTRNKSIEDNNYEEEDTMRTLI